MHAHLVTKALGLVLPQFRLDPSSDIHGVPHWCRVWKWGRFIVNQSPKEFAQRVDMEVLCWFSFLHDACRYNDLDDPEHGLRAAKWAKTLYGHHIALRRDLMQDLLLALHEHSNGHTVVASETVAVCWDADRLDLTRVSIQPEPSKLCTTTGRVIAARINKKDITQW